ncbi:MAG: hypothetical protein VYC34_08935, partial [Planctomycetota bacterium]|nr:hypothetical protein [Planctomycetota bacterium]
DSDVRALIVDLDAPELALDLIRRLREPDRDQPPNRIRIVAFGPHVARQTLQAARDAGADDVMPRGAFDHNLTDILITLAGRAG